MAGGALLILALIVHEMADIRAKRIALSRTPSAPALCGTLEAGHSEGPPTTIAVRIEGAVPPDAPYQRFDSVRSSGKKSMLWPTAATPASAVPRCPCVPSMLCQVRRGAGVSFLCMHCYHMR
eukprot:6214671-Pleurochrysis_carterae.AAC.1